MTTLKEKDIKHLAHLARLELTDEEVKGYTEDMKNIMKYVDTIQDVDTTGVETTNQVTDLENVQRTDSAKHSGIEKDLLAQSQHEEDGRLKVQSVM